MCPIRGCGGLAESLGFARESGICVARRSPDHHHRSVGAGKEEPVITIVEQLTGGDAMNKKLVVILLILAVLWWVYNYCGGNLRCPAIGNVMRSPLDWILTTKP